VPDPDLPPPASVLDPDRGAGADVRTAVRGGAGTARIRGDAGRPRPVEPAAGAAGPARAVVPLPSHVPRHVAGRAGTIGARTAAGPAPPRRGLVVARRAAGGSAGILHGRRRRRRGRCPGGTTRPSGLPPGPPHHSPALARVARRPGRGRWP